MLWCRFRTRDYFVVGVPKVVIGLSLYCSRITFGIVFYRLSSMRCWKRNQDMNSIIHGIKADSRLGLLALVDKIPSNSSNYLNHNSTSLAVLEYTINHIEMVVSIYLQYISIHQYTFVARALFKTKTRLQWIVMSGTRLCLCFRYHNDVIISGEFLTQTIIYAENVFICWRHYVNFLTAVAFWLI